MSHGWGLAKPVALIAVFWAAGVGCGNIFAQGRIQVEAYTGRPFGVGRINVALAEESLPQPLGLAGLGVSDANRRIAYPAVAKRELLQKVRGVLQRVDQPGVQFIGQLLDRGPRTDVYFLFTGDGPLEATLSARQPVPLRITPRENPAGHRRLMAGWWREYAGPPSLLPKRSNHPELLDNYLRAMLASRLNLRLPASPNPPWNEQIATELALASGTESLRAAMVRQLFAADAAQEPASQDVPAPPAPAPPAAEPPAAKVVAAKPDPAKPDATRAAKDEVVIEPMSLRVPQECFYVRFGSFSNFQWVQDTLDQWGGDFQNLVTTRGLDRGGNQRTEVELAMQNTALGRLLGDTVIADVAMVGTDLFLDEGASYGLLFQARNNLLLARDFAQQRQDRIKKTPGTREEKVKIGDREVSYLSSPDGAVRSYYAADGDFHFATTSKTLVRRFLETRGSVGSVGTLPEFREARKRYPVARKDVAFVYLSSPFFGNYASPTYRIEMVRRVRSMAEIEMAQAATLASAAEGKPGETIAELIEGGFLPRHFGEHPDGSKIELRADGARDTLRGRTGAFTPIADLPARQASPRELDEYNRFAAYHQNNPHRLAPILAAVRREAVDGNRNRITIDARMSPLAPSQHEMARRLVGEPETRRLAPLAADSVALEWIGPTQRFFGGLQFVKPTAQVIGGSLLPLGSLRDVVVGYVGTTGQLGILEWLDLRIGRDVDDAGYSRNSDGLLRRTTDRFTLFSFHRDVIESVSRELRYEEAKRPAQIRLRVADITATRMAEFANALDYSRTRDTSLGNLQLLHQLQQQLHVPAADAKTTAEMLLGATLVCPLGGKYELRAAPQGNGWTSTALESAPSGQGAASGGASAGLLGIDPPPGYQAPPLNWFRGLELEAIVEPDAAAFHAEILMQNPPKPKATPTPPPPAR